MRRIFATEVYPSVKKLKEAPFSEEFQQEVYDWADNLIKMLQRARAKDAQNITQIVEGEVDHGNLDGLIDDDHSQYHNETRADTWLSGKTLDNIANGANYERVAAAELTDGIYKNATTAIKGIASFASADFDVTSGAVSLEDTALKALATDSGGVTPSSHSATIAGGTGISTSGAGAAVTIALDTPVALGDGGTGQTTKAAAFDALSPLTTKGDLIAHDGVNNIRLGVGTNDYVLTADSTETSGLKWVVSSVLYSNIDLSGIADGSILFNNDGDLAGCPYLKYSTVNSYIVCGTNVKMTPGTAAYEWFFDQPERKIYLQGQDDAGDYICTLYAETELHLVCNTGYTYFDTHLIPYQNEIWDIGTDGYRVNELFVKTLNVSTALPYLKDNAADTMDVDGDACLTIWSNTDTPTANAKMLVCQTGLTPSVKFSVDEDGDIFATGKLAIAGNLYATTSDTYTLGTPTYKWKYIYISDTCYFNDILIGGLGQINQTGGTVKFGTDNIETSGTVQGEQLTSTDDIIMAGLLTNTLAADDAVGITIDGYTNDYTGGGDTIVYGIRNQRDFASTKNDAGVEHYGSYNNISVAHTLDGVVVTATDKNYGCFNQCQIDSDLGGTPAVGINEENYGVYNYVYKRHSISGAMTISGIVDNYGTKNYVLGSSIEFDGAEKEATFNSYGTYSQINMQGTQTNGTLNMNNYGDYIDVVGGAGGTSKNYGVYVAQVTGADENYGVYVVQGTNYFADNVGINDTAPAEKLDVDGNINATGVLKIDDVQVVKEQQAHIADAPGDTCANNAITINFILTALEAHGLLAAA